MEELSYIIASKTPLTTADGRTISLGATDAAGNKGNSTPLADEFDTTGQYTYTYDGGNREIHLTYASWLPKENAEVGSTPLIIWLHGGGEGGSNPDITLLGSKVVNLITDDIQQYFGDTGAAVLTPQSPTMWLDTNGQRSMAMGTSNSESFYTEALMSLIVDFVNSHPEIDATRIYIGGCSNGGYMTINMLLHYPGAFAAAYPICMPYDISWLTDEKLSILAQTPIWFTAAKNDSVVNLYESVPNYDTWTYDLTLDENGEPIPIDNHSNAMFDRLVKLGAEDVHYSLFDNVEDWTGRYQYPDGTPYQYDGHFSWVRVLNNECTDTVDGEEVTLFAWLAAQKGTGNLPTLPIEKEVYPVIDFYLTRHGQTEYNVEGIVQGWCDSPLTENGVALAQKLGEGLKDIPFIAAYSSDSGRAADTAAYAMAKTGIPVTQTEALREINFGSLEATSGEGLWDDEYHAWVGFDDVGGATYVEVGLRVTAVIEQAIQEYKNVGGNIFISSHGISIESLLLTVCPQDPLLLSFEGPSIENCSVTILEWDKGVFRLKSINDTSYLEG